MVKIFKSPWRLGALALALAFTPAMAQAEVSLVFGTYTSDKPSAMVAQIRPSLNVIARSASEIYGEKIQIRMQVVKSYKEGVEYLVAGKFDIMRLGPASYVKAKQRAPGIGILAMENKKGRKFFNGIICVPTSSPLHNVQEIKGKRFAFGNRRSTLGRYFAQLLLMQNGVFARDLEAFEYLGRHDKVGRAVGAGLFDAGALEETTFSKLVRKGVPIRAIAKVSNATRPWIMRSGLDPKVVKALRSAMLALKDPKALKALRFNGFLPGSDADYEPTRQAISQNPKFFEGYNKTKPVRQSRR